ncbi:hypothetical protein C8R47DRAFT_1068073 [Mycena vitilis]|nr:hypothetical protein C8R47DRAFT_1068073 [Mycena vitilis]
MLPEEDHGNGSSAEQSSANPKSHASWQSPRYKDDFSPCGQGYDEERWAYEGPGAFSDVILEAQVVPYSFSAKLLLRLAVEFQHVRRIGQIGAIRRMEWVKSGRNDHDRGLTGKTGLATHLRLQTLEMPQACTTVSTGPPSGSAESNVFNISQDGLLESRTIAGMATFEFRSQCEAISFADPSNRWSTRADSEASSADEGRRHFRSELEYACLKWIGRPVQKCGDMSIVIRDASG